jgi:hypothetical protein
LRDLGSSPPKGLVGFFHCLLVGHADIREQVGILREVTERPALAVPRPSKAPGEPMPGERGFPVILMKSEAPERGVRHHGWHIDKLQDS